jgi:hypothetical protein
MEDGLSIYPLRWFFFLALFPVAFFWLRRAWRIFFKHDFSEVALKRGEPPPNAEKYAPIEMGINFIAGSAIVVVIVSVLLGLLAYDQWIAAAGITLWMKIFCSFALSRHAHAKLGRK